MYSPFTPCAATAALNTAKLFSTIRPDSTGRFWETVHHKQNGTGDEEIAALRQRVEDTLHKTIHGQS